MAKKVASLKANAEKSEYEIGQISFFLGKEREGFGSILDQDAAIERRMAYRTHRFTIHGAECQFIYFETASPKTNPPWLDLVNETLPDDGKINFSSMSQNANGLLMISVDDRLLVATFGRSASTYLNRRSLESDFGIKTAMNMCGNEEIRQTKSQSNAIAVTQIDRQVSKPSDPIVFGLNEAEDLRYISAHMKGNRNITLQGRDSLTMKVIGEVKISWKVIIDKCREFIEKYRSTDYVKLFPNYRNFRAATDEETARLDQLLIDALKAKTFEKIEIGIPEFLPEDEYSYSYTNNSTRDNVVYSYLAVRQLNDTFDLERVTVDKLNSKMIYAYSPVESRILAHKKWPLYNCLIFETKLGDKYFILSGGRWSEVDSEFYSLIIDFIANRLHEEPCEEAFKNIDISDDKSKKNRESIFNERVVALEQSCILFDRAKLQIGAGRKDKEFCDILNLQGDGPIRIINVKQYKDASSINYLFSQAKFYCEAFLRDEVFLSEIRAYIQGSPCKNKEQYLARIGPSIEDLSGSGFQICLWLLYDRKEKTPTRLNIPLIAQYELKLMHDHLRKICKFNDIILRFVPVVMKQYTTSLRPKKAA